MVAAVEALEPREPLLRVWHFSIERQQLLLAVYGLLRARRACFKEVVNTAENRSATEHVIQTKLHS